MSLNSVASGLLRYKTKTLLKHREVHNLLYRKRYDDAFFVKQNAHHGPFLTTTLLSCELSVSVKKSPEWKKKWLQDYHAYYLWLAFELFLLFVLSIQWRCVPDRVGGASDLYAGVAYVVFLKVSEHKVIKFLNQ